MPDIVAQITLTQQQAGIDPTALFTPITTGIYRISSLADASMTALVGAGVELTVSGINSVVLDTPGGTIGEQIAMVRGVAQIAINYSVTAGPYGQVATPYDLYIAAELMQ
jgi:hypothetical protein